MLDSGATRNAFLDESFAQNNNINTLPLPNPRRLRVVDRRLASKEVTHFAYVNLKIGEHTEKLFCFVTKLGQYPLIVGMPWLVRHNPLIDFPS